MSDLRDFVSRQGAVAFVANGSILPRISGDNDLPARTSNQFLDGNGQENGMAESKETSRGHVVAFKSPEAFEATFLLPRTGVSLTGMLIPKGVTIISGGGFQGKTTLLKTLSSGYLDRVKGDGREYCVSSRQEHIRSRH